MIRLRLPYLKCNKCNRWTLLTDENICIKCNEKHDHPEILDACFTLPHAMEESLQKQYQEAQDE